MARKTTACISLSNEAKGYLEKLGGRGGQSALVERWIIAAAKRKGWVKDPETDKERAS